MIGQSQLFLCVQLVDFAGLVTITSNDNWLNLPCMNQHG